MTSETLNVPGSILIVEDVAANIDLLVEALGDEFAISVALDGQGALDTVAAAAPELILLDIMMPGMDGYEVCLRLRQNPATADIPIIFLTALNEEADEARGLRLGALDYIFKPFSPEVVRARVRNHIALRRAQLAAVENSRKMTKALEDLQRLERLRDDLVHMIVHDMRTPLMVVTGTIEMMAAQLESMSARLGVAPERRSDICEDMLARVASFNERLRNAGCASRELCGMVNSLLDVSRLEARQMPLRIRPVAIDEVARQVVEQMRPLFGGRHVELRSDSSLLMAKCDSEITSRILQNLVDNAVKHTSDQGEIVIEAARELCWINLSVRDDGPGIPAEFRQSIFEKFGQAPTGASNRRSTGLGLTFCKLAAEAQGGRISLSSGPTRGVVFQVALPVHEAAASD